ncbi:mycofactocin biosynthesis chaperone MftB [Saccharothrix luteola]|uniref:mycofactocin biosynthesis chaperone MftB n=1 Tax=Saccharothrix luteola TaxID=2893018 RepID=UPI001E5BB12E|nr:mycofactocin biosynthesis chaperone MftB [Saccharothrix luteola]MCC8245602.1 mycofactocin biosynthesis chaperone MftB [Saccharothrix luteola]
MEFDPDRPYRCSPALALRPEPFGALAYHFGTRRLSFLKSTKLVEVVRSLEHHPSAAAALVAAEVGPEEHRTYLAALARLAEAGTIEPRPPGPPPR